MTTGVDISKANPATSEASDSSGKHDCMHATAGAELKYGVSNRIFAWVRLRLRATMRSIFLHISHSALLGCTL